VLCPKPFAVACLRAALHNGPVFVLPRARPGVISHQSRAIILTSYVLHGASLASSGDAVFAAETAAELASGSAPFLAAATAAAAAAVYVTVALLVPQISQFVIYSSVRSDRHHDRCSCCSSPINAGATATVGNDRYLFLRSRRETSLHMLEMYRVRKTMPSVGLQQGLKCNGLRFMLTAK
jgi:hypothetical protein